MYNLVFHLFQMTPGHVEVQRCDGGCFHRRQSCLPKRTKKVKIPVSGHRGWNWESYGPHADLSLISSSLVIDSLQQTNEAGVSLSIGGLTAHKSAVCYVRIAWLGVIIVAGAASYFFWSKRGVGRGNIRKGAVADRNINRIIFYTQACIPQLHCILVCYRLMTFTLNFVSYHLLGAILKWCLHWGGRGG